METVRIAFLSDIHSNIHALKAVLSEIEKERIDEIYCCGDVVGYNAFPAECVDMVRKKIEYSVMGNHDYAAITGDTSWFNEYGVAGISYCRKVLYREDMDFLRGLPEHLYIEKEGVRIYIVHGSPINKLFEYVFPSVSEDALREFSELVDADILIFGHTHIPMEKKVGSTLFLNPGSVGQPRDGNPEASFMILDPKKKEVSFRRVNYDIAKAKQAIIDRGLPLFLADRLSLGI